MDNRDRVLLRIFISVFTFSKVTMCFMNSFETLLITMIFAILDLYKPSASALGKQRPPSSSTPYAKSTRPSSGGASKNNEGQHTAITKFSLEDFDDDDSF